MSIGNLSRYLTVSGGSVARVSNAAGVYNLTSYRTVPPAAGTFTLYTWKNGNRMDLVAASLLGNPSLWWAILDINPELIDPLNVPPGTVLRIPSGVAQAQGTLS